VIAKLILPETETPHTLGRVDLEIPRTNSNLLDAVATGTTDGLRLAVNVGAMLIAFLALTAMLDAALGWAGQHLLRDALSLARLSGWLFSPLAFAMGVPAADAVKVGSLLGEKTVFERVRRLHALEPAPGRGSGVG